MIVGEGDCDVAGLDHGGVVGRCQWLCTVDWLASVANGERRAGRRGYSDVPGLDVAGINVRKPGCQRRESES